MTARALFAFTAALWLTACVSTPGTGQRSAADVAAASITRESPHTVSATLDRIAAAVESKGGKVFARVNHAAGAASIGTELPATELLIVGNPAVGTPAIEASRTIGLDLPLRFLAWEEDGKTYLATTGAPELARRHGLDADGVEMLKITAAIDALLTRATAP